MDRQNVTVPASRVDPTVFPSPAYVDSNSTPSGDQTTAPHFEKRAEPRYLCCDPAEVRGLTGNSEYSPATVLDISRSGLRLELTQCLFKGMEVEIKLPGKIIILGEVRYSRQVKGLFHVGVRIEDLFYTRRCFSTDHLHDDQLLLYIDGKGLTASEVLVVRDHLRHCKACSVQYSEGIEFRKRLANEPSET